jgi:hypothetical protein
VIEKEIIIMTSNAANASALAAASLFSVNGLVALVTGGGSGINKHHTCTLLKG